MKQNPYIPGDPDKFIEENMGLAQSIAWKFIPKLYNQGIEKDDIFSMAYMGLVKAYNKFNPTNHKGENNNQIKFSTYAVPVIWSEISRNIRDHYDLISIPRSMRETSAKIRKAGYIREDDPVEISQKLNIPLKLVKSGMEVLDESYLLDSLDRNIDDTKLDKTLSELIVGNTGKELEEIIIVNDFLDKLSDRMRKIYELRMKYEFTQQKIAKLLGLSQITISKAERKMFELGENYCNDVAC
jgi:RNA polymerase sporulation-specific sigma factor